MRISSKRRWIEVFRRPSRLRLDALADIDDVVTTLPIVQEVLQRFGDEDAFKLARESLLALPTLESPLTSDLFLEAAQLYRAARRTDRRTRRSQG